MAVTATLVLGLAWPVHADPSTTPVPSPTEAAAGTTAGAATGAASSGATSEAGATATAAAGQQTGGDVLDQLAEEYAVGAGGGQLSNLLKVALKLRAMGFKPSKPYLDELSAAMKYRPNQNPLIEALKDTIAYQQKIKAQMDVLSNAQAKQGAAMGAGAAPGPSNPGYGGGPVSVVATP
ncbi:MAG: hypothetical protein ACR2JM_16010, partial [Mycobacterium sp.]